MRFFLSFSPKQRGIANQLMKKIYDSGHEAYSINLRLLLGEDIINLKRLYHVAGGFDYVLPILSKDWFDDEWFQKEFNAFKSYEVNHSKEKIVFPIITDDSDIPEVLRSDNILFDFRNMEAFDLSSSKLIEYLSQQKKAVAQSQAASKAVQEKIEKNAPEYITEMLRSIGKREKDFKLIALICYILGFSALIIGITATVWFANTAIKDFANNKENWSATMYYAIKSVVLIALLIAASKYAFNLGKSYMNESLRNADRIHAISFGEFYLKVFNQQVQPHELKEIFRDWNIGTQSSFAISNTEDYDPKFLDKAIELVSKVSAKSNKD